MEIQRQILCSIPSSDKKEMEKTIQLIAQKKTMVEGLRKEIKDTDPLVFQQIMAFEKATNKFKQLAAEKNFIEIKTPNENEPCNLNIKKGNQTIECLVKAKDESGGYTVINYNGEILEFLNDEVMV
ncbi:MAG: hypothetical protein RBQ72_00530 [Desulfobacterium sp.]|nr:hypothetical protein [Desulfobacterium sp.]